MPNKGQTRPFKAICQYPDQKQFTTPHSSFDDADRAASEVGLRGGEARVVFRRETDEGFQDTVMGVYGPDVEHEISEYLAVAAGGPAIKWRCTCGRFEFPNGKYCTLEDHLERTGMERVTWLLMRGESPGARAYEPGALDVFVPSYIIEWANLQGAQLDEKRTEIADPDVYLLVTLPNEAAAEVPGEIARRPGAVAPDEHEAIVEALNEADGANLPAWMRDEPR